MHFALSLLFAAGLALAAPKPAAAATTNVCTQAPYSLILPFSTYAPALSFCSQYYPVIAVTVTTTVTPTSTSVTTIGKTTTVTKGSTVHKTTTVTSTSTTTTSPPATVAKRGATTSQSAAWAACTSKLKTTANALSTACSCIETAKTTTVRGYR